MAWLKDILREVGHGLWMIVKNVTQAVVSEFCVGAFGVAVIGSVEGEPPFRCGAHRGARRVGHPRLRNVQAMEQSRTACLARGVFQFDAGQEPRK
jgi:hypothetical protein